MYRQVYAPGLPAWPRLFLDHRRQRAYVSERVVTWRSVETARTCATITVTLVCLFGVVGAWFRLPAPSHPVARIAAIALLTGVAIVIARVVLHPILSRFFARQIFVTRCSSWISSDAIAFRSPLYSRGVVVWRSWKNRPVQGRFDLTEDVRASRQAALVSDRDQQDKSHMKAARVLRLIISTGDPTSAMKRGTQASFHRSIPMMEISAIEATQFTAVLSAAVSLTAPGEDQTTPGTAGKDIDMG